ncbi:MAG: reverse transcriptase-like protein [Pyrinomonadaceae bacterium]|nr:reverse transcriptase-like protein [Pyrinomonadaceae bacterium]MCX7639402.1 reverse transcriptase-like protein [Pyrinomonadaceae bacterium]MDW8304548.1 RNase H family protein [Acidobacteriota bacterium]
MAEVQIICDGSSSLRNGKWQAACAALVLSEDKNFEILAVPLGEATNNQAEIIALCIGLERLESSCSVRVYSDSQYVVETMKGRFRKRANFDLWERLEVASKRHNVEYIWIPRNSEPLQKAVDYLAKQVAELQQVSPQIIAKTEDKVLKALNENR